MSAEPAPSPGRTEVRLRRILEMTPFLVANPGIGVNEVCTRFGIDRNALLADLQVLFMCGLPPYTPSDLFEVEIEDGRIWLAGAESLALPMGLGRHDAARLLTAGKLATELVGGADIEVLNSAIDKLAAVLGEAPVDVAASRPDESWLSVLRTAIVDRRVARIEYWSFGRDELTERDVEPTRLFLTDGNWYLGAHCRAAGDTRTFRLDRIRDVTVLDEHFDAAESVNVFGYTAAPDDLRATIRLSPGAAWVSARYPVERSTRLPDGGTEIEIAASAEAFLVRLVIALGGQAEILEPPWLRDAVASRASDLLELYR